MEIRHRKLSYLAEMPYMKGHGSGQGYRGVLKKADTTWKKVERKERMSQEELGKTAATDPQKKTATDPARRYGGEPHSYLHEKSRIYGHPTR